MINIIKMVPSILNIAMVVIIIATFLSEEDFAIKAPLIALCSALIINLSHSKSLKARDFLPSVTNHGWVALASIGLTVATGIWLTDAVNQTKNMDATQTSTLAGFMILLAITIPIAVIIHTILRVLTNRR